ncbi:MAG: protein-disulfide reductase DsbD family protein [Acidobacteria bacterium]|nr:protein-disulfide reductase DsbD family protein [Acidobacteriota bacterium]
MALYCRVTGLAVITYDPTTTLAAFAAARGITFLLLSDEGSATIREYGLLNDEMNPDRAPEFTVSSIAVRLGNAVAGTDRGAARVETDHLVALAWATDDVVAPGNRLSLVADVTPKPNMHVYAPGDHGYRVIRLRTSSPEFLRCHEVSYPQTEMYRFEPLDETVPVYKNRFRLVQDVTIPMRQDIVELASGPGATLHVDAVLEYQACDHEACYLPQAVPVSWDLFWRPLIRD